VNRDNIGETLLKRPIANLSVRADSIVLRLQMDAVGARRRGGGGGCGRMGGIGLAGRARKGALRVLERPKSLAALARRGLGENARRKKKVPLERSLSSPALSIPERQKGRLGKRNFSHLPGFGSRASSECFKGGREGSSLTKGERGRD